MYWKLLSSSSLEELTEVDVPDRFRDTELQDSLVLAHDGAGVVATEADADDAAASATAVDASVAAAATAARAARTSCIADCTSRSWC
jgi:hypothetical protein